MSKKSTKNNDKEVAKSKKSTENNDKEVAKSKKSTENNDKKISLTKSIKLFYLLAPLIGLILGVLYIQQEKNNKLEEINPILQKYPLKDSEIIEVVKFKLKKDNNIVTKWFKKEIANANSVESLTDTEIIKILELKLKKDDNNVAKWFKKKTKVKNEESIIHTAKQEEKIEVAKSMKKEGFSNEQIVKITDLTIENIENL